MKLKTAVISAAILVLGAVGLHASDMSAVESSLQKTNVNWLDTNSAQLYRNYELSLEGFVEGTVGEHRWYYNATRRHFQPGAGAGLEFFFQRYVGVEAEAWSEGTHHSFVNDYGGNLVLRLPIGDTWFAPYIFGGGGHQDEPRDNGYADGGAGLEVRPTQWFSVFADGRFMSTEKLGNYGMGRVGIKFIF